MTVREIQELKVDAADRSVPAVPRIGREDEGIGRAEVIVPPEEVIAFFVGNGKGRAADVRGAEVNLEETLGEIVDDEVDELVVVFGPALGEEVVEVVAAVCPTSKVDENL